MEIQGRSMSWFRHRPQIKDVERRQPHRNSIPIKNIVEEKDNAGVSKTDSTGTDNKPDKEKEVTR